MRHTFDHVVDQGAGQAVQGTALFFVIGTFYGDDTVVQSNLHRVMDATL